jgi:hypothetical protein
MAVFHGVGFGKINMGGEKKKHWIILAGKHSKNYGKWP